MKVYYWFLIVFCLMVPNCQVDCFQSVAESTRPILEPFGTNKYEYFFVLQPHCLAMYAGSSEKDKRGEITLDGQCRVEACADLNSKSPLKKPPGAKSHSRFQLFANEKIYEFQASDHR